MKTFLQIQNELKSKVNQSDHIKINEIDCVGAFDITYIKNSDRAIVYYVLISYPDCKVLASYHVINDVKIPYQAGFLAFREMPLIEQLWQTIPDSDRAKVLVFDGNGILHPNHCGIASHFGVVHDIITIGCAKNLHQYPELTADRNAIKHLFNSKSSLTLYGLVEKSGKVVGAAVNFAKNGAINPIYVSIGHKISLDSAVTIIKNMTKCREPEPIRIADRESRKLMQTLI